MKKIVLWLNKMACNIINGFLCKRKKVKGAGNLDIRGLINLHGNGVIEIGNNVKINSSESSNPIGGMTRTTLTVMKPGVLKIGDNVGMSNVAIVCRESVTIEDNVLLGGSVKIYDTDFHSLDWQVRGRGMEIDVPKNAPVVIKEGAFIGAHCIVLKGVTVGKHSILGAGSVLTKSIPDGQIWAGNPAKFIRVIENGTEL